MHQKKWFALVMVMIVMMLSPTSVFANSALGDWATSYSLQGSTEVYYSAPWLVKGVQWFISWTCIIAFLCYYMSYLCSIVVLSNKELFYTIDVLKREGKDNGGGGGGGEKSGGMFGALLSGFKNGSTSDGLNGGADNIVVFFLMMSVNFKAYSVYKNVEAGSEGDGGGGSAKSGGKYSYSDTMMNFFLKSLFNSIMVTFILSCALSGLLIRVWFNVGDVLIVKADRFAQVNLTAKLDEMIGNDGIYTFSFPMQNTRGSSLAHQAASKILANILAEYPGIEDMQAKAIGVVVENTIFGNGEGVATMGASDSGLLGGDYRGYDTLTQIINATMSNQDVVIDSEENAAAIGITMNTTTAAQTINDTIVLVSLDEIVAASGLQSAHKTNKYIQIGLTYNQRTGTGFLTDK